MNFFTQPRKDTGFPIPVVLVSSLRPSRMRRVLPTLCCVAFLGACGVPPDLLPDPVSGVSFSSQVKPIFTSRCTGCHGRFGIIPPLTSELAWTSIVNQPAPEDTSLMLVVPGDAEASFLFNKVSSESPPVGFRMPLIGEPLTAEQIGLIRDWINQGALDN